MIKSKLKSFVKGKSFTLFLVLVLIIVVFEVLNNNYLKSDNIKTILYASSASGLIAIGMAPMMISGNIDLSAGSVGCIGSIICAYAMFVMPWVPALLLGLLYGVLAGLINSFLINKLKIMAFIATLAMSSVWSGIGNIITDTKSVTVGNESFWKVATLPVLGIPMAFVIVIVLTILLGILLNDTGFGRKLYIIGGNRTAARLAGINVGKISTIVMCMCSAITSLSGMIMSARLHTASNSTVSGQQMYSITALMLGGVSFAGGGGGMFGAFIGLLMLNTFNNGLTMVGLDAYWSVVASGLLLIVALTIDSISTTIAQKKLRK